MPGTSFQEPALPEDFQYELVKREIGGGSNISQLVLAAIGLDTVAIFCEFCAIRGKQRRRNRDFAADVAFGIYQLKLALQQWVDFFVTCDVNDENIVAEMPQDIERAFKPISIEHIRDYNRQPAAARFRAIRLE